MNRNDKDRVFVKCPKCGGQLDERVQFCMICGASVIQDVISAPEFTFDRSNAEQLAVDALLKTQGFTVAKTSGKNIDSVFININVTTEDCMGYIITHKPLTTNPAERFSLKHNGKKLEKYADMTAYTLDSRYGFIYAKNNEIYRWVGTKDEKLAYNTDKGGFNEIVGLHVLGEYLLVTELVWCCTKTALETKNFYHCAGGSDYETEEYSARLELHIFGLEQSEVIKSINSLGLYPGYVIKDDKFVIKAISCNDKNCSKNTTIIELPIEDSYSAFEKTIGDTV